MGSSSSGYGGHGGVSSSSSGYGGHGGVSSSSSSGSGSGYESPMVKQELAKLDKGGDKRRSALVSLRACVDKLDAATMPRFLSQLSDSPSRDLSESRPFAISLYQDVARVHGPLLIPHIPRIMATLLRSLASSGSSLHLHHACAAVVAAIARYAILPTAAADDARPVLRDLSAPLLEVLSARMEPLAGGAAACLHALVESERWRWAAPELAAEVAGKCCGGFRERSGQTVAHLQLARALVKQGAVAPESGLGLLRCCKEILRSSGGSWQQRAAALQLVRGLMLGLDRKSLSSESDSIAGIVEQIRLDRMPHVRNEAVKALQTLKAVVSDEGGGGTTARTLLASAEKLEISELQRCRSLWERESGASLSSQESQLSSLSPPPESPGGSSSSAGGRLKRASVRSRRPGFSSSSSSGCSSGPGSIDFDAQKVSVDERRVKENLNGIGEAVKSQTMENLRYHSSKLCTTSEDGQCVVSSESYRMEVAEFTEQETPDEQTAAEEESTPVNKKFSDSSTPERSGVALLTAEDFIRFTTPRRLVRSLQTLGSPETGEVSEVETVEKDESPLSGGEVELVEASSETGWSVRDNPIAEDESGFDKLSSSARQFEERDWDLKRNLAAAEERAEGGDLKKVRRVRCWERARGFVELVLAGCVCMALSLPVVMAVIRALESQGGGDMHSLVPT